MPFQKAGSFWKSSYQINAQVKSVAICAFRLQRSCDYACQLKARAILSLLAKNMAFHKKILCSGTFLHVNGPHLVRSSVPISAIQQISLILIQTRPSLHLACRLKIHLMCFSFIATLLLLTGAYFFLH